MSVPRLDLKAAIIRSGRTQREFGLDLRIVETRLSALIRGRAHPTTEERRILREALGADYFEPEPVAESQAS